MNSDGNCGIETKDIGFAASNGRGTHTSAETNSETAGVKELRPGRSIISVETHLESVRKVFAV